ncbi:hypothetical protein SCLCIDRAFT_131148, partial [Scleroderma citrinum Foug A]
KKKKFHAALSWHHSPEHYDTVLVKVDKSREGMESMDVAHVLCFFSLPCTNNITYPCALIHWYDHIGDAPDTLTGMWMVKPAVLEDGRKHFAVIHIDSIVCSTHLLPVFGQQFVPSAVSCHNSLDLYHGFYVNHFADHHMFKLVRTS